MNWYHNLRGQYSIDKKTLSLDWGRLFLHPEEAEMTFVHELVHGIIAEFDFGQATNNFFRLGKSMTHLDSAQVEKMRSQLFSAHEFLQEGHATLMQILNLSEKTTNRNAIEWANTNLPQEYLARFNQLKFVIDFS